MSSIKIDRLADEVMKGLNEYAEVTTENVKKAVRKAASTVRREIQTNAPKKSGDYAKSWTAKKVRESSHTLEMVVHSRNKYQLAHLKWWCIHETNISLHICLNLVIVCDRAAEQRLFHT